MAGGRAFDLRKLINQNMKRKVNEDRFTDSDSSHRVVIKLKKSLHLPCFQPHNKTDVILRNHSFSWYRTLEQFHSATINKLFTSLKSEAIQKLVTKARKVDPTYKPANFFSYYVANCPAGVNTDKLLKTLSKEKNIELAYVEKAPAVAPSVAINKNPIAKSQKYLDPAPTGIDAKYAWAYRGGDGEGRIKFIDIEQGWMLDHEDLSIKVLPFTGTNHEKFKDHGTAVMGAILMRDNRTGGIGITPKANGHIISQWRPDGSFNNADAIMSAISYLEFGDILLLEAQCFDSPVSCKLWPLEIQDAVFEAIRLATALGIIVIEAAGNGNSKGKQGNNLDNFRLLKKKILNRNSPDFKDSGAIIVGASSSNVPHQKIDYSNCGNRIDCYAWGEDVVTAGYFPWSSGYATNTYTDKFNGTSSATAIVAGIAIAVQSIIEANHCTRLSPKQMRDILSSDLCGTRSANGRLKDKIGVMPDLKKIIDKGLQD